MDGGEREFPTPANGHATHDELWDAIRHVDVRVGQLQNQVTSAITTIHQDTTQARSDALQTRIELGKHWEHHTAEAGWKREVSVKHLGVIVAALGLGGTIVASVSAIVVKLLG